MCHYSPLATPRRRAGKRARTAKDAEAAANVGQSAIDIASAGSVDRASSGEPLGSSSSMRALSGNSIATVGDVVEPVIPSTQAEPSSSTPEDRHWKPEATEMRRDINMLSQRFNSISSKLDYLIKIVGKRRRGSIGDSDAESGSDEEVTPGYENENRHDSDREAADRSSGGVYHDFNNRADRTSRFNIDATNVGNITGMMENIDRQRGEQQLPGNDVHVSVAMRSPRLTNSEGRGIYGIVSGLNIVERAQAASAVQMLDTPEIQEDLIDKFYLNADVNTISFIPRYIFHRLREEKRTPTAMLNLMMAGACNYSSHEAIIAIGRGVACGIFIERAYKALFDCLEYDSAEHCVSLLLFAMVISNTGLHRAWIMQSLSTQMAIRLRFNTIDSPLSALAFKNDSELIREWKRRVFWQLYSFELLSNTLSDLPPCLSIDDVRCNAPRPLTEELASSHDEQAQAIAALGPAVLFCEDQSTISLQIELMRIMCDISSLQNRMTPEENMFPPKFMQIHAQLAEWKQRLPHLEVLVEGNMERLSTVFKGQPGLIVLGLLCQYVQIYLCLIKDTWLPTTRAMTAEETKTLDWARTTAYETAQVVHRLVPFVQGMRLNTVSPVVSNVVFQACVVSVYSCGWKRDPRRILAAVQNVQSGLGFLDYVSSRWGFSSIMTTSLRSMIVERGFGATGPDGEASPGEMSMDDDDLGGKNPEQAVADEGGLDSSAKSDPNPHEKVSNTASLPESLMQPFQKEANWERILRTGEIHSLEFEIDSMRGPCTRMCKENIHASDVRRQDDSTE
ncbi:hypothetical protein EV175_005392 [Coemansia sp. RSA 1933]|nr:hypothetical protein EV175_005392 [Coemansia sp. RSA 1933]